MLAHGRGLLVLLAVGVIAVGCSRREPLHEVRGRVTFQGQPVTEGIVVFENDSGTSLTTEIRDDGTFAVGSYEGFGLPAGTYQVAVRPPVPDQKSLNELMKPVKASYPNIPQKYRDSKTSQLTADVRAGLNEVTVEMQPTSR